MTRTKLVARRSSDGGRTWAAPTTLAKDAAPGVAPSAACQGMNAVLAYGQQDLRRHLAGVPAEHRRRRDLGAGRRPRAGHRHGCGCACDLRRRLDVPGPLPAMQRRGLHRRHRRRGGHLPELEHDRRRHVVRTGAGGVHAAGHPPPGRAGTRGGISRPLQQPRHDDVGLEPSSHDAATDTGGNRPDPDGPPARDRPLPSSGTRRPGKAAKPGRAYTRHAASTQIHPSRTWAPHRSRAPHRLCLAARRFHRPDWDGPSLASLGDGPTIGVSRGRWCAPFARQRVGAGDSR